MKNLLIFILTCSALISCASSTKTQDVKTNSEKVKMSVDLNTLEKNKPVTLYDERTGAAVTLNVKRKKMSIDIIYTAQIIKEKVVQKEPIKYLWLVLVLVCALGILLKKSLENPFTRR